ncbi:MAG: hypothetical protein NZM29_02250 [Nitrospira sp.]|nr:hypothetical protein [Nitrospira sp.]
MANLVSLIGLALVWSVVWANLPSREELLSEQAGASSSAATRELDLTIPGVAVTHEGQRPEQAVTAVDSRDHRLHRLSEAECLNKARQACPPSLPDGERLQCEALHLKGLSAACGTHDERYPAQRRESR